MREARSGNGDNLSREDRLAAKLRENLKRRKAQARAMADEGEAAKPPLSKGEPGG